MAYQEYLSQQGAYFEEFCPDDKVKWNNYQQSVDKLASLNKLTAEAMENMLDRDLQISSVNDIYMKLEEFPKPEDAQNIVVKNSKYNAKAGETYKANFVRENMKFNRVFTLTTKGINSFLILDAYQFKDDSDDPYSDITVSLNAETGYMVYVQNETDSKDLITLDTYVNFFAEGETVSFIADKSVRNVELINGDSISEISLREDVKGNYTGSFTMPANDVTLRYHASCENHNFSENGFCVNCGFYQPDVLNGNHYEISNAGMLYWFASLVNDDKSYAEFETKNGEARAVLVKDIIVNTDIQSANIRSWKPIMP